MDDTCLEVLTLTRSNAIACPSTVSDRKKSKNPFIGILYRRMTWLTHVHSILVCTKMPPGRKYTELLLYTCHSTEKSRCVTSCE